MYPLLIEVLEHAWDYGYFTASGHDWILDAYSENEGCGYWANDSEFYGDKSDQVFLKLNEENEKECGYDWSNPNISDSELIATVLDIAYYHGYISPSGHDWILDAFRENEECGYNGPTYKGIKFDKITVFTDEQGKIPSISFEYRPENGKTDKVEQFYDDLSSYQITKLGEPLLKRDFDDLPSGYVWENTTLAYRSYDTWIMILLSSRDHPD